MTEAHNSSADLANGRQMQHFLFRTGDGTRRNFSKVIMGLWEIATNRTNNRVVGPAAYFCPSQLQVADGIEKQSRCKAKNDMDIA